MGFSTLDINTAMLAASSTVVEHAKCHHVRGSYLQSQNQFMPRLPEDIIPSCQLPVYVLKQKLPKILQNYTDPLLVLQENIFKLQAKKNMVFFLCTKLKAAKFHVKLYSVTLEIFQKPWVTKTKGNTQMKLIITYALSVTIYSYGNYAINFFFFLWSITRFHLSYKHWSIWDGLF